MTLDIPKDIEYIPLPRTKRMFDISISFLLLILLAPFIIFVLLLMSIEMLISREARGTYLYAEVRITQGKPFTIYKFRIFKRKALSAAKNGNNIIHTKDLEHTKNATTFIGRILKQVYLDELPQLYNILKGDMTFVGPRPTNPENVQKLLSEKRYAKLRMKAGLTGYFQSHKGIALQKDQETIDTEYVEFIAHNPGWKVIIYDCKILLISLLTIFRAEGI